MLTTPIIFLDIDGVINTTSTWGKRPMAATLQRPLVARVQSIAAAVPGTAVVITSTWRRWIGIEEMRRTLETYGLSAPIVGYTAQTFGLRQDEILAWRVDADHAGPWVVLDDDTHGDGDWRKVASHLIAPNPEDGLTDWDVRAAIEILGRK